MYEFFSDGVDESFYLLDGEYDLRLVCEVAIFAVWRIPRHIEARRQETILDLGLFAKVCYTRIGCAAGREGLCTLVLSWQRGRTAAVDADDAELVGRAVTEGGGYAWVCVEWGSGRLEVLGGRCARSGEDAGHRRVVDVNGVEDDDERRRQRQRLWTKTMGVEREEKSSATARALAGPGLYIILLTL